jgi:hypothetical protein
MNGNKSIEDEASEWAINETARKKFKSSDEMIAYKNKIKKEYIEQHKNKKDNDSTMSSTFSKKKQTYIQPSNIYWEHFESNNRY